MNSPFNSGVLGAPSFPMGMPTIGSPLVNNANNGVFTTVPTLATPQNGLMRACSFAADHQGCGFWRLHWPEMLINGQQLGIVNNNNFMVLQDNFYQGITSVRIQRQVTPIQLEFVKYLRNISNKTNKFKIYYDIDDVIFPEDIPLYNRAREAFVDPTIAQKAVEVMKLCDGITTPTEYMSKYYEAKSGTKGIVLPDYMPRFWIDRFYNKAKLAENFELYKRRPRVAYIGSPTHFNVAGLPGVKDDFAEILGVIIKTIKTFKWIIFGGLPHQLAPYISNGEIEYVPWAKLWDYPTVYNGLNANIVIAPLQNNVFNLAKAPIKYLEAGAFGLPCVCQNLEPYKDAPLKFNTADEMIDVVKKTLSDRRHYLTESDIARKIACKNWLEDHINEYVKIYFS